MRVVVQIPCLNEEDTLPQVLQSIPTEIPGVDEVVVLVIDDGSTDRTVEVAREHGVTEFVHHARNQGLGRSFHDGVARALELGADIVVNTDGDNQYPQERITDLVQPIIEGRADIVIADRQVDSVEEFSRMKIRLQRFGSRIVSRVAGTPVPDATSGFRAYSRDSLMLLNTVTRFSYCLETIIQAGNKKLKIVSVPIRTNPKTRESRLFKSMREHMMKSAGAIIRSYIMYKPYAIFTFFAMLFGLFGLFFFVRFGVLRLTGDSGEHVQSILAGAVLLIVAFLSVIIGITADLIRTNRMLIEDTLEHTKKMRFGQGSDYVSLNEELVEEESVPVPRPTVNGSAARQPALPATPARTASPDPAGSAPITQPLPVIPAVGAGQRG